jgi:hypothetical protein
MYIIEMQFVPNNDIAWVMKLNEQDLVRTFETIEEAESTSKELEQNDNTGRKYRVKEI